MILTQLLLDYRVMVMQTQVRLYEEETKSKATQNQ